jgi:hypothetical protein
MSWHKLAEILESPERIEKDRGLTRQDFES